MRWWQLIAVLLMIIVFGTTKVSGQTSPLSIQKVVNKSQAELGEILTYTVTLTNSGTASVSTIVVDDMVTAKATYIPNSATASVGAFTSGFPSHTWALASLPASGTATLVYSASVISEGIIFNSAIIPNVDTAQVCTTIPFRVCAGSNYAVRVNAPTGYSNYKFYNGTTLVQDGSLNSYTATAPGEYKVVVDNLPNVCSDVSCCPVIIAELPVPSLALTANTSLSVAAGTNITLTASGCVNGTVTWPTTLTGTNALTRVVSPTATIGYSATCTTGPSCFTTASLTAFVLAPQLVVNKLVSKTKAQVGEVISYTVIVANTGLAGATNIVVQDSISNGVTLVPGSMNVSSGNFTMGSPVSSWNISSLPANTTATMVYSVSVGAEGIVYAKARVGGNESTVCISVPFRVCPGDSIGLVLNAPGGYTRYEWYNGTTKVYDGPLSSYTATAVGEYKVIAFNGNAQCQDVNCCPVIIEEDIIPAFVVVAQTPTCITNQPQSNGRLTIIGLGANSTQYRYRVSVGNTFNLTTGTPTDPVAVPADGIIANTLNAVQTYTVRVYSPTGCYRDFTVTLTINCTCPPEPICVPIIARRIRQ